MNKKQYNQILKEVLVEKKTIQNKLNHVSIKEYAVLLRNRAANEGIEMTPKEVEEYLILIKSMLEQR